METEGGGMLNHESKDTLVGLQGRRNTLLLEKEETWQLKSRALWLACGDENTICFHAYAKGRKALNTIWCLEDDRGRRRESFEELAKTGVEHLQNLFKAPVGSHSGDHASCSSLSTVRRGGGKPFFNGRGL